MTLCDAHCHYHYSSLADSWDQIFPAVTQVGLVAAVVNGTRESDWENVRSFVRAHPWCRAAYGIHPWQAPQRRSGWEADLCTRLAEDSRASVGEIGFDAAVAGHDLLDQQDLFLRQWTIAAEFQRPVSVHCVKAWDTLRQTLKPLPASASGFLIHAYNGPPEWIPWFAEKGAYFSFSPYFLLDRKRPQREAFRSIPPERVLIETDAPDLSPPPEHNPHPWQDTATGQPVNHPANLAVALGALAATLDQDPEAVATLTSINWTRLFDFCA